VMLVAVTIVPIVPAMRGTQPWAHHQRETTPGKKTQTNAKAQWYFLVATFRHFAKNILEMEYSVINSMLSGESSSP
jgi:hypothetical protein